MTSVTPRAALSPVGASAKDVRMGFEKLTQRLSGEGDAADVTSMIDVLFLLLLFSIVTTTSNADSLFPLEWTQSDHAPKMVLQTLVIEVSKEGRFAVDKVFVPDLESMAARVAAIKRDTGVTDVIIKTDRDAHAGHVVRILNVLQALRIDTFPITAKRE